MKKDNLPDPGSIEAPGKAPGSGPAGGGAGRPPGLPGPPGGPPGMAGGDIPWPALMVLVIGGFMAILDGSIVNVALPKLMAIFNVSADSIQWVMTAYLLVSG
ncbi:MAG: hypothetical protein ACYC38_14615, partial [Eubacteriales bacterium]